MLCQELVDINCKGAIAKAILEEVNCLVMVLYFKYNFLLLFLVGVREA